jgi:hypothetical protein
MQIQSFRPLQVPPQNLKPQQPTPPAPEAPPQDQADLTPPAPEQPEKTNPLAVIARSAVMGAAALAAPTLIGAAAGVPGAIGLGVVGAAAGLLGGKASGFITLDFRFPAALILGGGSAALALAGNAWGGPAVLASALVGAAAMGTLMARNN